MTVTITSSTSAYTFQSASTTATLSGTRGSMAHSAGIYIPHSNDTLINSGTILGGYQAGVYVNGGAGGSLSGIVISNQSAGIIHAYALGGGNYPDGVLFYGASGTIVNAGQIIGAGAGNSYGINMLLGGTVTNTSTGIISGGGIRASGAETIVNSGKIYGDAGYGGVNLAAGGIITNLSGGTITANGGQYGIRIYGGGGTITNAGTISEGASGTLAISMSTSVANRLIVDPGAVFVGNVNGGTPADATLELASGASTGTLSGFGNSLYDFGTVTFDAGGHWLVTGNSLASGTTFNSLKSTDTIDITGFTATAHSTLVGGLGVVITKAGGGVVTLKVGASLAGGFVVTTGSFGTDITTICFCRGTMISTPKGQVKVEDLAVGDLVMTLGEPDARPITWIGMGKVLSIPGKRGAATPVIVRKSALADNVPNQDLHLTKGHSLYIDNVLIPVEFLVNHRTILWDDRAQEVEIYHIELDRHDVLLANGTAAESYRDDGNRWLFQNANEGWDQPSQEPCAPVLTGGPIVDAAWRRFLDYAGPRPGLPLTEDADLHLMVDGARLDASGRHGTRWTFALETRPASVRIASRAGAPMELGLARDPRALGVAVRQIQVCRGAKLRLMEAEDPQLIDGFHGFEPDEGIRWTNGDADIPASLFDGFDGSMELVLRLDGSTRYPMFADIETHAAA